MPELFKIFESFALLLVDFLLLHIMDILTRERFLDWDRLKNGVG